MNSLKTLLLGASAAALTLVAGTADAATLTRAPYLQQVTPDSALVAFRTDVACDTAQVRYGEGTTTSQSATSSETGIRHAVALDGLKPAAEYTYVVDACGAQSEPKRLRTAPEPGTRRVHFAAVGDFGNNSPQQKDVFDAMLRGRPELFLALGDNAYDSGTEAEFQNNLFAPMADLLAEVPIFPSLGNHEYGTTRAQPYIDNFYLPTAPSGSERFYSFDWGHVHFVALDSSCANGKVSFSECSLSVQKEWLEKDLAASKAPWKVVYFHHPTWSSGSHGSDLTIRNGFGPLFEKYGVDLVLTGHDHNYERTHPMKGNAQASDGITYLVVGNGGRNLRDMDGPQPSWSAVRNNVDYGYLDVVVEGGTLTANLLTASGAVKDSFTLTKDLPAEPELTVTVEGQRGVAPHTARLRATTNLENATVRWNFGDGQTAEGLGVQHTFSRPGTYTVTATATDGQSTVTRTTQVEVANAQGQVPPPTNGTTPGTDPSGQLPPDLTPPPAGSGCSTAAPAMVLAPLGLLLATGLARRRRR